MGCVTGSDVMYQNALSTTGTMLADEPSLALYVELAADTRVNAAPSVCPMPVTRYNYVACFCLPHLLHTRVWYIEAAAFLQYGVLVYIFCSAELVFAFVSLLCLFCFTPSLFCLFLLCLCYDVLLFFYLMSLLVMLVSNCQYLALFCQSTVFLFPCSDNVCPIRVLFKLWMYLTVAPLPPCSFHNLCVAVLSLTYPIGLA